MDRQLRESIDRAAVALKECGAREVYIIGSVVSGRLRDNSDIDLAVSGLAPHLFFRAMGMATEALGRTVDLIDLDDASPFTVYLKEEGDLLRVA